MDVEQKSGYVHESLNCFEDSTVKLELKSSEIWDWFQPEFGDTEIKDKGVCSQVY